MNLNNTVLQMKKRISESTGGLKAGILSIDTNESITFELLKRQDPIQKHILFFLKKTWSALQASRGKYLKEKEKAFELTWKYNTPRKTIEIISAQKNSGYKGIKILQYIDHLQRELSKYVEINTIEATVCNERIIKLIKHRLTKTKSDTCNFFSFEASLECDPVTPKARVHLSRQTNE